MTSPIPSAAAAFSSPTGRIEIRGLTMSFSHAGQQTHAVRDIDLEVGSGEFISVIGPSGCGKSTILNLVAGFISPTSGSVMLDGAHIAGPGSDRGVVFQQYSLFPWKNVLANVEFGLKLQGVDKRVRRERARNLLRLAGLSDFESFYPGQLSGGMKQRVGIIRALAANPRILLMDEPFGALDTQTRSIMQQILLDLWQTMDISVLFITHDIDEAIFLSDRIYVMTARPGSIKAVIPVELRRPRLAEVRVTSEFLDIRAQLHQLIGDESHRAAFAHDPSLPTHLAPRPLPAPIKEAA